MNCYTELFNSGFVTDKVDYEKHVVLLPQQYTSICDLSLVVDSDIFNSILKKARSENPMNEAILVSLHDALQNEEFSLYQLFIQDNDLMDIYMKKRNEYSKIQKDTDTNLFNVLKPENPYLALDADEHDEEFENYKENINTIIDELEGCISTNSFLDIFICENHNDGERNTEILTKTLIRYSEDISKDNFISIYSAFSNILFTGKINCDAILQMYRILADICLQKKDYETLDDLFSIFIEKLYPDE